MKHIAEMVVSKSRPKHIFILSFLLIFLTISLAFAQQKTTSDSIPFKTNAFREKVNIGYGELKKSEITSSITSINSTGFNHGNTNNPWQLIQGKVAGLDISKPGGDPNGSYYLRLRGLNIIYANTEPLVVIDGIIDASINNVDPNDIESITVLKDGASAAIYGTRSSNGVIQVTTKRGKPGTAIIDYNTYITAEMVAKNEPAMSSKEWRALNSELGDPGTDFGQTLTGSARLNRKQFHRYIIFQYQE